MSDKKAAAKAVTNATTAQETEPVKIKMSGAERAALFLMALGEHEAAEILKLMGPREVQVLGTTMANLNDIRQEQIAAVLDNFIESVGNQTSLSIGTEDYLRKILRKALGNEKAESIMARISLSSGSRGLESLRWMDARAISEIIKHEHPQIIALVLVYLDTDHAGEVIRYLPDGVRTDVIIRIAKLDGVHPSALSELDALMDRHADAVTDTKLSNIGGVKAAAGILGSVPTNIESEILRKITEVDADFCQKIQDQMFIFENLLEVDDRGLQTLLREVSSDSLVIALRGTSTEMQEKIFKNMSKRAAEMLKEDLETTGPVKISQVEEAQKSILVIARKLAEDGQISLGGGDDLV